MNPSLLKRFLSGVVICTLMQTSSLGAGFPDPAPPGPAGFESGPGSTVVTQLQLYPNIETIGVVASGSSSNAAELLVRQSGDTTWHPAHPLMRIDDGRLVGSLFGLAPATSYDVKVLDGPAEISRSITTQQDELQFTLSTVLHVSANAPAGGNGSVSSPFQTIQEGVNHAGPGTQVLVADGIYHEAVVFPASGSAGNWIQVKAEGSGAILDGSQNRTGSIWTATTVNHVYFTKISGPIAYLARDQLRFYAYETRAALNQGVGHNGVAMNEGWFFEASTLKLFVRSRDNPSSHSWQIPILNYAFDANGRDWLWIEGFEMRFYGTTTSGCGVCTTNTSHLVVRKNKIHNLQLGVFFNWNGTDNQGNDTRVEFNEIYDPPVNEWPWAAVKGSSMEGTAIVVRGHIGAIVRGNELHNFFNGIYTGSSGALENSALAFDADIYNNHIHHISDDALEPEGACINQRFRNNIVDTIFVGMSLAPITQGPTWVLHSLFTNYSGRGFKWDGNSDGIVLIYHNTSWSNAAGINAMDMISAIHNVVLRNNIFQSNGLGVNEVATGSTGQDWNDDNWYITRAVPHFKWENVSYNSLASLCAATGLECNGYENPPGLTNPSGGDFTLLSSSPNIDRGVILPGINDGFAGSAPDVGAFEYAEAPSISGNVGMSGVLLSYTDGTPKSAISEVDGSYSIQVPAHWNGTITPYYPHYSFQPDSRSYTDLTANQTGQDYTAFANNTEIFIAGSMAGSYYLASDNSTRQSYINVDGGPVRVYSTDGLTPLIASQRINLKSGLGYSSYSEFMGIPGSKLSDTYLFPWYNNAATGGLSSELRFANVGTEPTSVTVTIAGVDYGPYPLAINGSQRVSYNLDAGPVKVHSSGEPIVASIAIQLKKLPQFNSYTELLGLSASDTASTDYLFPWYNNASSGGLDSQLRFGNVGTDPTTVTVKIGGVVQDTYPLDPGDSLRVTYSDLAGGPVEVSSSGGVPIIASMRVNMRTQPNFLSYAEYMGMSIGTPVGLSGNLLGPVFLFPWYNNDPAGGLDSQLRFGYP